tara:strand:- start:1003 stop:1182 length:180 start_codon:yes stop_codon:yes gene_type:complete
VIGAPLTGMMATADENRRLKKMYAEMAVQNELLKDGLGKRVHSHPKAERWPRKQSRARA